MLFTMVDDVSIYSAKAVEDILEASYLDGYQFSFTIFAYITFEFKESLYCVSFLFVAEIWNCSPRDIFRE